MNNNRNNNNRRRGRGNNRQQGGQQLNRIDSRARGNAPQMLEKYRKMAHDAHLNGDRVTEEYNLQFADHYFRVIADQRQRQDEARQPRREDGVSSGYGDDYSDDDYYGDTNSSYDRAPVGQSSQGGQSGHVSQSGQGGQSATGTPSGNNGGQADGRSDRGRRPERGERGPRQERSDRPERVARPERTESDPAETSEQSAQVAEAQNPEGGEQSVYQTADNPFLRESRPARAPRARKPRRDAAEAPQAAERSADEPAANVDPSSLPPAISTGREKPVEGAAVEGAAEEAPAKPKRRTRRTAPPSDDAAGALETVN